MNLSGGVFDMFDTFKPDIFIAHAGALTADILKYLVSNRRIECIFNITGSQQENLDALDTLVKQNGIRCPFFFTNQPESLNSLLQRNTKLISVMHGADIFLSEQPVDIEEYKIDLGVFTNYDIKDRLNEFFSEYESYHVISSLEDLSGVVDVVVPPIGIHKIYGNYSRNIIATENLCVPQSLFDSLLYGNKTYLKPKYSSQDSKGNEVIQSALNLGDDIMAPDLVYIRKEDVLDFNKIRSLVLKNHTCLSRVKTIFSNLKCRPVETAMDKMIEEKTNDYCSS